MKKFYILLFALIPCISIAQTVFWTETFGSVVNPPCDRALLATSAIGDNGSWTQTITGAEATGATGFPNAWYISASENGNSVGQCGSGCGTNRTLHIGNSFTDALAFPYPVDNRAWYFVGMDVLCGFIQCGQTDRRIESPTINCTGRTNITLNFDYIEGGTPLDNASLWYSANNGGAWTQIADMPKTAFCDPPGDPAPVDHGIWANFSIALPASADNNPSVKIGFRWTNNDDATWADPSIAIDNITLSTEDTQDCCDGDFNCDGVINVLDMIIIVNQVGCTVGCTADLNNDNLINASDLTIFNGLYGDICP